MKAPICEAMFKAYRVIGDTPEAKKVRELEVDAMRYRFLRKYPTHFAHEIWGNYAAGLPLDKVYVNTPEKLDGAIDAAIIRKLTKGVFNMATAAKLLNDAILAMSDLHNNMTPDEREENAIVPPDAVRRFVDAHARLMYERERMTPNLNSTTSNVRESGDDVA